MSIGDLAEIKPSSQQMISNSWEAVKSTLRNIWIHVVIGLVIGAAIHGWAPGDWLARYAGKGNLLAIPFAVLVGIPLLFERRGHATHHSELTNAGVQMGGRF